MEVLTAASHKTKPEVERLVAALSPKPAAPALVRRLPVPATTPRVPDATESIETPEPPSPVAAFLVKRLGHVRK